MPTEKLYRLPLAAVLLALALLARGAQAVPPPADPPPPAVAAALDSQDVAWDSPSANAFGSMPIGNGDIGLNVWVETSGDLVLLIGKTDAFDEFNRLLKIGRLRLRTTPALFAPGQTFSQVLRLRDGAIEIKSGAVSLRVWVDANHPVAQVDLKSVTPVAVQVLADNWRKENGKIQNGSSATYNQPDKLLVNADTVLPGKEGQIGWCHHNVESQWQRNLELTALGAEVAKGKDPVLNRAFGAVVRAARSSAKSATELKTTSPTTDFSVQIASITTFANSPEKWQSEAEAALDRVAGSSTADRVAAHRAWWDDFWGRSWITIEPVAAATLPVNALPWKVGMDSNGGSRFRGEIAGAAILDHALRADEVPALAAAPRPGTQTELAGTDADLKAGFTLSAWIKPAEKEAGRIFDKCRVGSSDGFVLDAHPGLSLRWIAGGVRPLVAANCLIAGEWQHVAATVNAEGAKSLYLNGKLLTQDSPVIATVARAYTLQRFVSACSGRGALPIKFNGSIFTVAGPDPDHRNWGGAYWFQNTREAYWPMLYAGDYDMMLPFFAMYRNALPLREAATQKYYGHAGAFFPETMYFWGNYADGNYGLSRKGKPDGLTDNTYIRRYWQGGLELTAMMLDYFDGTQDARFRDETLLPLAKSITTFFDLHWDRKDGKIYFSPAQSLETWHNATNPLPEIAGLHFVLPRLLKLETDEATKAAWRKTLADLPPVPIAAVKGKLCLQPAETFGARANIENPELYAIFPYRLHTSLTDAKSLEPALNAWAIRRYPQDIGWQQHCIQAALLGLAPQAKAMVEARARSTAGGYRFPGFFGPNYDWTPEQCHGTNMMTAMQRMVMQCEGDHIVLLPAWPKAWNGTFKLHAPKNTTVEGHIKDGMVLDLKVEPESRRKDVEFREAQ